MSILNYGWTDSDGGDPPRVRVRLTPPRPRPSVLNPGTTVSTNTIPSESATGAGSFNPVEPGPYEVIVTFGRAGSDYFSGAGIIGPSFINVPEGTSDLGVLLMAAGAPLPPPDWKAVADVTYAPLEGLGDIVANAVADDPTIASKAPLPTAARNPLTGYWHADGYGAVGNGSTDDKNAINAAMVAASAAGGGVVYIKPTNSAYMISSSLTPRSKVTLFSHGATLKMSSNGTAIYGSTVGLTDFAIDGLIFEGGVTENATAPKRARTKVTGMETAVSLYGNLDPSASGSAALTGFSMRNCIVRNCSGLPIFLRGVGGAVQVHDNQFINNMDVGFVYCPSVQFNNNYVYGSADNGVSMSRVSDKLTCVGNVFENCAYNGIWAAGFGTETGPAHFAIAGNVVKDVGHAGIFMDLAPKYGAITGNVLDGAYRRGPSDEATDSICVGIFIGGFPDTDRATPTNFATDIVVMGNQIRRFAQAGIFSPGGIKRVMIANNLIDGIGTQYLADGATAVSSTDAARNIGILISFPATVADVLIQGNKITDARSPSYCNYAIRPNGSSLVNASLNEASGLRNTADLIETGPARNVNWVALQQSQTRHLAGALAGTSASTGTVAGFDINGAATSLRHDRVKTASLDRFSWGVNGNAEAGSNAGSDFDLRAYTDAGAYLGTVITAKRSNLTLKAEKGYVQAVKAGVPSDADFATTPSDGTTVLDTTNHRLYVRSGASWRYTALT
ncbi:right-handed parallel beta-helix repeat-containing protein [Williamsia soli]|uniref:right-handed parallel beta-helix repeat-containing protein n=1 Tax=Williamsia soli TaxID=364929 RepID=UPI001A9F2F29|nr:right-handed parallel beta-helix repeat-containing protein [Williamsia soli]